MKRILIFAIIFSSILFTGCSSSFKASYDPFLDIGVELLGSDSKGEIVLDTSRILASNIKLANEAKMSSDDKNKVVALFKEVNEQINYQLSKGTLLTNGDEIYISFIDITEGSTELQEVLKKNISFSSNTMTYIVDNLEKLYTEKSDLTNEDYQKIQTKSESLIKSYLSKLSSENKKFSSMVYRGQFVIDKNNADGSKSILTVFTGVVTSKMIDSTVLNEYVYPYIITDINYDLKGKAIFNYDGDVNYISRYYQADDINELFRDKFDSMEDIEIVNNKKFKSINDLPSDYFNMFDVSVNKELSNITKDKVKKEIVMGDVNFHKCYLLTDKYKDSNDKDIDRNSIVLVYTYTNTIGENITYGYSVNIFNYFLYNNDNVLIDYKTSFKQNELLEQLTDDEIIGIFKTEKSSVEEIPL